MLITIITLTIVYLIPLKETILSFRSTNLPSLKKYSIYWACLSLFDFLQSLIEFLVWENFIWIGLKIILAIWLYHPNSEGWVYVQERAKPYLQTHSATIQQYLGKGLLAPFQLIEAPHEFEIEKEP